MRALAVVLAAALAIHISGTGPALAEETATPGLWINPELGLATPADAAERYKAPFHTWLREEGDYKEPDWRRRIFFRFVRPSTDPDKPRISHKVASCAVMLTAWRNGFGSTYDLNEPGSLLNGRWSYQILKRCLALEHLSRLRPIATSPTEHPDFLARSWTVRHLSPLAYSGISIESLCSGYSSEVRDAPHLAIYNRGDTHGGGHVFHGVIHRRRWDAAISDGYRVWALWAQVPAVEVAGIAVSPRIRLESEHSDYTFTVYGVGSMPELERPVLIVLVTNTAKGGGSDPTVYSTLVLAYDAEIEIFRVINLEDFEHYFRHYDCVPPKRK